MAKEKKKQRTKSLSMMLGQYFFILLGCILVGAGALVAVTLHGLFVGYLQPANMVEKQLSAREEQLSKVEPFQKELLPKGSHYALFNSQGELLESDMLESELDYVISTRLKELHSFNGRFFKIINRKDSYLITSYLLNVRYGNDYFNKMLPMPAHLGIIIYLIYTIMVVILLAWLFSRRLKKGLAPLMNASKIISEENVDLAIEGSDIKEFRHVSQTIDDMRNELKTSLETSWNMEHMKKEQIAALAHDIKTPLTIIKGNNQLLGECELDEEATMYHSFIEKNIHKIEEYMETLMEVTKSEADYHIDKQKINLGILVDDFLQQVEGLAMEKEIQIDACYNEELRSENLEVDATMLQRALMNIVSNGLDYTPKGGTMVISISKDSVEKIIFVVEDGGQGFSQEALKRGREQFYTSNKSRSGSKHYGMGLHIAWTIAKLHGGDLELANNQAGHGKVALSVVG